MATLPRCTRTASVASPGPTPREQLLQATLAGPVGGLETDACLTADGRLVLLHDPWLSGATTFRGWAHQTLWSELRRARLRDRDGTPTNETPMLLDELLDGAPRELPVQVEVKSHGDPALARASAAAVCRVARGRADRDRVEVLSFHTTACEEAARQGMATRLIAWADYMPAALARWAACAGVGGVCIEHFLLHPALVERLRRMASASRPGRSTTPRSPREPLRSASTRSPPIDRRRCTTSLPRRRWRPERRDRKARSAGRS